MDRIVMDQGPGDRVQEYEGYGTLYGPGDLQIPCLDTAGEQGSSIPPTQGNLE